VAFLIEAIATLDGEAGVRSRGGVYAVRNLLELSAAVAQLAESAAVRRIVEESLGKDAFAVRGILFDKTAGANWLVPWHQDLTIAVAAQVDVPGNRPWSKRAAVWHVQPPVAVLEEMLSVRIHLDGCDESNGALRVLPGTHRLGRLTSAQIADQVACVTPVACAASPGDVLLMRPLLLHASSAVTQVLHRRVIHLDFAFRALDGGLEWFTQKYKRRRIAPAP
jgi:ectoine hydroxylase-related dioxygenase (phytanoyl-CoA dioxygenase family)